MDCKSHPRLAQISLCFHGECVFPVLSDGVLPRGAGGGARMPGAAGGREPSFQPLLARGLQVCPWEFLVLGGSWKPNKSSFVPPGLRLCKRPRAQGRRQRDSHTAVQEAAGNLARCSQPPPRLQAIGRPSGPWRSVAVTPLRGGGCRDKARDCLGGGGWGAGFSSPPCGNVLGAPGEWISVRGGPVVTQLLAAWGQAGHRGPWWGAWQREWRIGS